MSQRNDVLATLAMMSESLEETLKEASLLRELAVERCGEHKQDLQRRPEVRSPHQDTAHKIQELVSKTPIGLRERSAES